MRAVVGEVNDSCFLQFSVEIQGDTTGIWTGEKTLIKGSSAMQKGKFKSSQTDTMLTGKAYLNYKDFTNTVQIIFTESKLAPISRIRIGLPNPEKYNVGEFFVKGHLEIETINVISRQKTVDGGPIMKELIAGKKINLLDKLFFERLGDPLLRLDVVETSLGAIEQIRNASTIEI